MKYRVHSIGEGVDRETSEILCGENTSLKYVGKEKVISGIKRISKPGLRVYVGCEELPKVLGGLGIAIVSTSNGIMTDKKARQLGVGGEVLAFVW